MKIRLFFFVLGMFAFSLQATPQFSSGSSSQSFDLEQFLLPVPITKESIETFFLKAFNNPRYVKDRLPYSLDNFINFLRHGKQTQQGRDYMKATFCVWSPKIKQCDALSAAAFTEWLVELPALVDYLFVPETATTPQQKKQAVKKVLYREFLSKFSVLSENPSMFFDNLADEVLNAADPDINQGVSLEHLRQMIVRFIETCMNKLFWDPSDKDTWANMKHMGDLLGRLKEQGIIKDVDDLNDLCWSLVHRVCHFVSYFGPELPMEFYEEVRKEIQNPSCILLTLEEQESLMETKRATLERAIIESVARIHAHQQGLFTEQDSI